MDVDRHRRGQTLSSVFGTQVQTSCNTQTNLCSFYRTLGFNRSWQGPHCNVESYCDEMGCMDRHNDILDNSFSLLQRNFLQVASSSNSSS